MKAQEIDELNQGERVWRWVWTGARKLGVGDAYDVQELTVVRVNRVTVTVDSEHHGRFRVPREQIAGRCDW